MSSQDSLDESAVEPTLPGVGANQKQAAMAAPRNWSKKSDMPKQFQCEHCMKQSNVEHVMMEHHAEQHDPNKLINLRRCQICIVENPEEDFQKYTFERNYQLVYHLKSVHGVKQQIVEGLWERQLYKSQKHKYCSENAF